MTADALNRPKDNKFYFNINIFDDDHVEEEEELAPPPPPPPPTFSEEELALSRSAAYEKGRSDGYTQGRQEEIESREQLMADTLQKIAEDVTILFEQESQREKVFETEVVSLTLAIFEKLFPLYQREFGFAELRENITRILRSQQNQKDVVVKVSPQSAEGVNALLSSLKTQGYNVNFTVIGEASLPEGACRLLWSQGGAISDTNILAEEIRAILQQVLAGRDTKGHDSVDESSYTADTPQNAVHPTDEAEKTGET